MVVVVVRRGESSPSLVDAVERPERALDGRPIHGRVFVEALNARQLLARPQIPDSERHVLRHARPLRRGLAPRQV